MRFDPFAGTDEPDVADKFRPSLVTRARKREVIEKGDCWLVQGDEALGDSYPNYVVRLLGRKYGCSCHGHNGGQHRKVCSHVLAVILFRQDQRRGAVGEPDPVVVSHPATVDETHCATIPDPIDTQFGQPPFPSWVTSFRPHQWQAVEEIIEAFKTNDLVFLDAPTGAGKTLIAEMVRRLMRERAVYVCSTKSLQAQFMRDYPYAKLLQGRSNYETILGPVGVTCGDCTHSQEAPCSWCPGLSSCPYQRAKKGAMGSPLAVLNTAYFLAEANYIGEFAKRGLVIVDECDVLEKELMGFVEVAIGERRLKELKVGLPDKVTKPESWAEWVKDIVIPAVRKAIAKLPVPLAGIDEDVRTIRNRKALVQLLTKLQQVAPGITSGNWVFDGYGDGKAIFRPVRVDGFGHEALWQHGKKWLCMSATIISSEELVDSLGCRGDYATVRVPMTFPVENRPIRVAPIASMKRSESETSKPIMAAAIKKVCERHPGERVLVHTVSYDLARYLYNAAVDWPRPRFMYTDSFGREQALADFRKTDGAVMFAPSLDRGVSLDDDDCRVVVVAKMPFLSLGDKQVNARLHSKNGQSWYSVAAVRSLVQSTGRGVRSADDWCETYILDRDFVSNTLKKSRSLLPSWWLEALDLQFQTTQLKESA